MAIDLNAAQVQRLKAAGLTSDEIRAYQLGKASTAIRVKASRAINGPGGASVGFPVNPYGGAGVTPSGGVPQHTPNPSNSGTFGYPQSPSAPTLSNPRPKATDYGGRGRVDPMPTQPAKPVPASTSTPTPTSPYDPFTYSSPSNPYNLPEAPGAPNFTVPSLEMRDFTEQAKKIAAEAFAPYLAAFDIAKANAQAQGKTSKEATAGLYANFVKDIAAKAAETADRYDEVKGETAARGEAEKADIAESQGSANANIAQQLASLGLDVSAPDMLQQGAAQQTQAQAEAGQATESQQQYLDKSQLAQGNYDTQYGNIMGHQGLVAQQDLDSQLMNVLSGIDIGKANATGEQGTTSIQLAQQLADRDYQMQAQNANNSIQEQQLDYQGLQDLFQNQIGLYNTWEAQDQQDYANAFDLWKTQQGLNIDWASLGASAGAGGSSDFDMSDYPNQTQTWGWLKNELGDEAAADKVYQAIDGMLAAYTADASQIEAKETVQVRAANFARQVAQQIASTTGIPMSLAQAAAANYYQEKKA